MESYLFNVLLGSIGPIILLGVIFILAILISNVLWSKYSKKSPKKITIFKLWGVISLIILVFQGIKPQLTYKNTGYDVNLEANQLHHNNSSMPKKIIPKELQDRSRPIEKVTDEELRELLEYKIENNQER